MITTDELKKKIFIIKNIIDDVKTNKNINKPELIEEYFWDNHSSLMKTYPFLISHLCSGKESEMLSYMIKSLEAVEDGKDTKDNVEKDIGQKLADIYVKPKINN